MPQTRDPERSVFINCPYDGEFAPIFDAIVFATVCSGFVPRSALEYTTSDPRIERILRALFESFYSIHDLSRCRGEGSENLARFNMPLELGIALARQYMTKGQESQHQWFLFVPGLHYREFVSDLAGYDPVIHDGTVDFIVRKVMAWLNSRRIGDPKGVSLPKPPDVLRALPGFRARLQQLGDDWAGVPWDKVLIAAEENIPKI